MPEFNAGDDQSNTQAAHDWQEDYEQRVNAQARSILDSEQYNAYTEYQQWQREMREQLHHAHKTGAATSCSSRRREGRRSGRARHRNRREAKKYREPI